MVPLIVFISIILLLIVFNTLIPPIILFSLVGSTCLWYIGFFAYLLGLFNPILSTPYIMMSYILVLIFLFLFFIGLWVLTIGATGFSLSFINILLFILAFWIFVYLATCIIPLPIPLEFIWHLLGPLIFIIVIVKIFI